MKYTKLIEGTTFYHKDELPYQHYWIGHKTDTGRRCICWKEGRRTAQTTYPENQVLRLFNNGTWVVYEEIYEIY